MFEYEPLYKDVLPKNLLMIGGGSSGSGSSTTGTHDWPPYMKAWHADMLSETHALIISSGATPPRTHSYDPKVWFGLPTGYSVYSTLALFVALDVDDLLASIIANESFMIPPADLAAIKVKATALRDELLPGAPYGTTLDDLIYGTVTEGSGTGTGYGTAVDELIDAHSAKLLAKVNAEVLPKVEMGMRDVNAVIGSSFVIAREIAMEDYTEEVADFSAKVRVRFWELRHELYKFIEELWFRCSLQSSELAFKYAAMKMEKLKLQVSMAAEIANAAVLAQSKYGVISTEGEIRNKSWKIDLYDHMSKAMASIAGASPVSSKGDQSAASAMFTGGLGMAAMGAGIGGYLGAGSTLGGLAGGATAGGTMGMAGGPAGALIGAGIGLGVGIIGGLLKR